MSSRTQQIIGCILTGLLGLFLIGASGVPKFIDFPGKQEMFDHLGVTAELSPVLGIIEVIAAFETEKIMKYTSPFAKRFGLSAMGWLRTNSTSNGWSWYTVKIQPNRKPLSQVGSL
jgi:hypothetical protein